MPKFSKASLALLEQCHPDLQLIMKTAIKEIDFSILSSTIRTIEEQEAFVKEGKSKTMNSRHLKQADGYSYAVDIWKYPINWNDEKGQTELARYILGVADGLFAAGLLKQKILWGGDWKSFVDMPHFEIVL